MDEKTTRGGKESYLMTSQTGYPVTGFPVSDFPFPFSIGSGAVIDTNTTQ